MAKKQIKSETLKIGDTVSFNVGRLPGCTGKVVGVTEVAIKYGKKIIRRKVSLLSAATALAMLCLSLVVSGCATTTAATGNAKTDSISCAKDVGAAALKDAPAILKSVITQDWNGALAELVKTLGPGILCEVDVLVELLKGHGDLAGAVGAVDGAVLGAMPREVMQARLEAFRSVHPEAVKK